MTRIPGRWHGLLGCALAALAGCSSNVTIDESGGGHGGVAQGGTATATSGSGGAGAGGGDAGGNASGGTGGTIGTGGCMDLVVDAVFQEDPVDLIFVVDNSGSMADEVDGLKQHINSSLIPPLVANGLDHRVIMLTQHGDSAPLVCVPPPLSSTGDCTGPPVNVPGQFYHYSVEVQTHDSLCKILSTLQGVVPDDYGLAPGGWISWLRPEALKAFVEFSDDGVSCGNAPSPQLDDDDNDAGGQQVAATFDQLLLAASPAQFGTPGNRHYVFYGLLGMVPKNFNEPVQHYGPSEPITTTVCVSGGSDPGTGYQWLSKNTNALRFPACNISSYPIYFPSLAEDLKGHALNPCRLAIPDPPPGEALDLNTVTVLYTPGGNGTPQELTRVDLPAMCGPANFYLSGDALRLCDSSCATVKADPAAKLQTIVNLCFSPDP